MQLVKALKHAKAVVLFYKYICDTSVKIGKRMACELQDSVSIWRAGKGMRLGV